MADSIISKFRLKIKQDKKLLMIIIAGFIGIFLIFLSGTGQDKKENTENTAEKIQTAEERMAKELEELIKTVEGAGKVKVMITVDSLEERIVAVNENNKAEDDSYENMQEYVIIENSGKQDGLTLKIITPVIRGVGITCEGASSNVVKQEITMLVSATLGIPQNRIQVTKMQE